MATTYGSVPNITLPSTVVELKDYVKRRLGYPVVQINVSDEQIYDRIGDTLQFYRDYHYDGTQRTYLRWQLTETDITRKYLVVGPEVVGVSKIFNSQATESSKFTSVKYSLMSELNANDVHGATPPSYVEYVQTMQKMSEIDMMFRGLKPIRFNRNEDRLYIDMDWSYDIQPGTWIIAEAEVILDPQIYTSIFHERFVLDYATALIKMQWGENIKKFGNIQLPGGLTMEGQTIYDEGKAEKDKLEEDILTYTLPPFDLIG